jgi:signal transduction histidine kinase
VNIRTKLTGLLSGLLLLVIVVSTVAGRVMLSRRVDDNMRKEAEATAQDLALNLEDYLKRERSDEEVKAKLEEWRDRHRIFELSLLLDSESGEQVQIVLPQSGAVEISYPERPRRPRPERAAYDSRRALWDGGDATRAPSQRGVEPLWRLAERGPSSRWGQIFPTVPQPPRRSRNIKTSEDRAACARCFTATWVLDPSGPQRGKLRVTVPIDRFDQVLLDQLRVSAITGFGALLVLLAATAWIVHRVVARPVSALGQAMREVEHGNLHRRVDQERNDEVGSLSRGFNAMLDRLAQADEEIRALNARLADDIAAATRDLQAKNEALVQMNQLLLQVQRELGDKERLAALGQLAAQLAHEIGTPLAAVSGHLQLATYGQDVPAALRERLQVATGELSRVSKIIRDYLDHTRAAKPTIAPTDLRRLVEEAVRITTSAARRPGVRIIHELDPQVSQIATDPGLLRQILINLLTNALDATMAARPAAASDAPQPALPPGPGRIVIAARPVLPTAAAGSKDMKDRKEPPPQVELSVRDEGTGIAADDLLRIFEPFYTTKGRGRGTGLGLSICRELARTLGGTITVESTPGQGSTFAVRLPIGDPTAAKRPTRESALVGDSV